MELYQRDHSLQLLRHTKQSEEAQVPSLLQSLACDLDGLSLREVTAMLRQEDHLNQSLEVY